MQHRVRRCCCWTLSMDTRRRRPWSWQPTSGHPPGAVWAAGGMSDPTMVRVGDLMDVADDRLLASVRELRKRHGFPRASPFARGRWSALAAGQGLPRVKGRIQTQSHASKASAQWGVPCVYSLERTEKMQEAGTCATASELRALPRAPRLRRGSSADGSHRERREAPKAPAHWASSCRSAR